MRLLRVLFLLCMTHFASCLSAQTTVEEWGEAVSKFGQAIPQEKVFLHTDNSCYFLGDTIFYRAYTMRSDRRASSGISGVLYVELLNADGYLIERQQVEMKGGMGTGSVVLDTVRCMYAGYYELRAYTRWQLNWGQTVYPHSKWSERWFYNRNMARDYYRDYEKLYSRVFPVYDHPLAPGDYTHDMTQRTLQRYFKHDAKTEVEIKLYPEGGQLIAGTESRLAFEAKEEDGRHLRGQLRIADGDGNIIAEAPTVHRGRGVISFTPQAGDSYRCTFTTDKETYRVRMPKLAAGGAALRCSVTATTLDVEVSPCGMAETDTLGLTLMNNGVVCRTIDLSAEGMKHSFPLTDLPTGVIDVTVFNTEGRVYSDRLVFNPLTAADAAAHTITITGGEGQQEAYAPVTLTLRSGTQQGGTVSLSVMDAATTENTYDNGTLLTEMLLSSEIRGFVEDPGYYFEAQDDEHRTALDLLMMVQGWRRFSWHQMAHPKTEFAISHPYEVQTPIMTGSVNKYRVEREADIFQEMAEADMEAYMADSDVDPWADEEQDELGTVTYNALEELRAFEADAIARTQQRQEATNPEDRFEESYGNLKREVLVHAEFSQPGSQPLEGEMETEHARFKIQSPLFDGECYFFLSASDSARWGKGGHQWISTKDGDVPEFYVRIDHPYPRFAHPYNFYQTAPAERRANVSTQWAQGTFDDRQLDEITVRVKRSGMRAFDKRYPALVIDAQQAFNYVIDAGLSTGQFLGSNRFCDDVARAYIGDMGQERRYVLIKRLDDLNASANISEGVQQEYNQLKNLDWVKIYTDFSPRHMGDSRWVGSDQPTVTVDLIRVPNGGQRIVYRDRRMILQGFSICEDFYNPDYSRAALPSQPDYRRTLYWNPALPLDANGEAKVTLYRNSRKGELVITANGFTDTGQPLSGESK